MYHNIPICFSSAERDINIANHDVVPRRNNDVTYVNDASVPNSKITSGTDSTEVGCKVGQEESINTERPNNPVHRDHPEASDSGETSTRATADAQLLGDEQSLVGPEQPCTHKDYSVGAAAGVGISSTSALGSQAEDVHQQHGPEDSSSPAAAAATAAFSASEYTEAKQQITMQTSVSNESRRNLGEHNGANAQACAVANDQHSSQNSESKKEQEATATTRLLDYSSKTIKSKYFSDVLDESSVTMDDAPVLVPDKPSRNGDGVASHNGDGVASHNGDAVDMSTNNDLVNKQRDPVINNNDQHSNEDKYEKILKKTVESKHVEQLSTEAVSETATSSVKLVTQNSYEAAVNRAFSSSSNAKEKRFSSDRTTTVSTNPPEKQRLAESLSGERISQNDIECESHDEKETNNAIKPFPEYETDELRMSSNEDGKNALERTTTIFAGNRESTDELIKRILAESRGETLPTRVTSHAGASRHGADHNDVMSQRRHEPNSLALGRNNVVDDDVMLSPARGEARDMMLHDDRLRMNDSSDARRAEQRRGMYARENFDEYSQRSTLSPGQQSDDNSQDNLQRHRYRSGFMQKQAAIYDDYAETFRSAANRYAHDVEDDEDERYYVRRRPPPEEIILPDEEFIPKKAEDTDEVGSVTFSESTTLVEC